MSNFVPNEVKTVCPKDPEWLDSDIKKLLRNQNKIYKRYKRNGYKMEDKIIMDRLRDECHEVIKNAKEKYLRDIGAKPADPTTGQKSYWKILNSLNKCKILTLTIKLLLLSITLTRNRNYLYIFCFR